MTNKTVYLGFDHYSIINDYPQDSDYVIKNVVDNLRLLAIKNIILNREKFKDIVPIDKDTKKAFIWFEKYKNNNLTLEYFNKIYDLSKLYKFNLVLIEFPYTDFYNKEFLFKEPVYNKYLNTFKEVVELMPVYSYNHEKYTDEKNFKDFSHPQGLFAADMIFDTNSKIDGTYYLLNNENILNYFKERKEYYENK